MPAISTTRLSSKGQVVIPEEIRERLGLEAGTQFVVVGEGDAVILRVISPPSKSELASLLAKSRSQAKRAGIKQKDVEKAVRKIRKKR
jgi:AbrB family looped-hinge helix DNA binding protein